MASVHFIYVKINCMKKEFIDVTEKAKYVRIGNLEQPDLS